MGYCIQTEHPLYLGDASTDKFYDVLKDGTHHYKETEGGKAMTCKAIEAYGYEQRFEGRAEGKIEEKIATAKNLQEMGMDAPFIAKALKVTQDVVDKWLEVNKTK